MKNLTMLRGTTFVMVCGLLALTLQVSAQPGGRAPRGGPPPDGRGGPERRVTPDELVARVFSADANQDGKLTKDEMTDQRLARLYSRADADKDGVLTREELHSLFAAELAVERGASRGPDGPRDAGAPGRGAPPGADGPPRLGQVLPPFVREQLKLSYEQQAALDALQRDVDAKLENILTPVQKEQLRELRSRGPGGPGGRGGQPGRGPERPPQD